MMTARKRREAMTVPAIAAIEMPWGGGVVGRAEGPEVELELGEVEAVGEGEAEVEDGDELLRQVLSSDRPTTLISELPP
jgi:hypothetical protein